MTDEVCDDNFYNYGYETSVEAEDGDNLKEESLKNLLGQAGIGILTLKLIVVLKRESKLVLDSRKARGKY